MPTKTDPVAVSDVVKLRGSEQTMIVDSFVDPAMIAAKSPDYGPAVARAPVQTIPVVKANCLWINAAGMPVEHPFDVRHLEVVEAASKDAPAVPGADRSA